MSGRSTNSPPGGHEPESYLGPLSNLGGVLVATLVLLAVVRWGERPRALPVPREAAPAPVRSPLVLPVVEDDEPPPPPPRGLDRSAIARAEAAREAASRDRARAEARAEEASRRLAAASAQAAVDVAASRSLASRVRDPSAQIARASSRGMALRAERDRLKGILASIVRAPRPKAKSLIEQNPVAKPAGGDEYHFEVRRNRVSFIDLDRLLALVKSDAQLRIRLSDNARLVDAKVGPVGAFSLQYALGRSMPLGVAELMERHGLSYDLRGWEIIPEFEGRGETYDNARQPYSEFARAVNRLSPSSATITMWVYPDGFPLYRKLRDDLHGRGFMVAARPLPEGMAIRGSPVGSLSAGQ